MNGRHAIGKALRILNYFHRSEIKLENFDYTWQGLLNSRKTMSTTTKYSNHLIHEKSPYLLQHARNPVNWYPWNEEAISRARKENMLIFLSVGYSTCHWCHVMERESFENESIAAIMNEHFVNIKVDREERPDIDKTYMTFIQLTSGNGGWPMSVFLTPDLNPIAGGTYFPPEDKWGRPGFRTVLLKIAQKWKDDPQDSIETGNRIIERLRKVSSFELGVVAELTRGNIPEADECAKLCLHQLSRHFDEEFGGFEIAPKFPQPSNLLFLFHFYSREKNSAPGQSALRMALKTLKQMNKGGIHDHVGQGFARYSTDERWHVPHFEKMLYDQAQLVMAYATAFLITKDSLYAGVVRDILQYVDRDLSHEEGGFYSAEDADSLSDVNCTEKREGAFYVWKHEEIERLLGRPLTEKENVLLCDVFSHHYNVHKNGNVEPNNDPHGELIDQNVLIVMGSEEETAEKFQISVDTLNRELESARKILFNARNERPRPHLDTKIITSWNGLMISGYSKAAQALHDQEYKTRATKAANFIKKHLWQNNELLHCCYTDNDRGNIVQIARPIHGFLNDYVFLIRGLLDLYEITYQSHLIEWCEQLQDLQDSLFWDSTSKIYNLASSISHSSVLTVKEDQDGAEPSGNSVVVQNLLRLSALLEREDYEERAKQVLSAFVSRLTRFPASLPEMTSSLMSFHDAVTQIFIVENEDRKTAEEMLSTVHEFYIPNRMLAFVETLDENSILCSRSEIVRNMKTHGTKSATAHICCNRECSIPVTGVKELRDLLIQKS